MSGRRVPAHLATGALLCFALLARPANAQDDEAIPYGDDPRQDTYAEPPPKRELPRRSEPTRTETKKRRGKRARTQAAPEAASERDDATLEEPLAAEPPHRERRGSARPVEDGEAIPYGSDEEEDLDPGDGAQPERLRSYASLDDPNTGVGLQFFGGAALLHSSRGGPVEARPLWGARFTWEFGRVLFADDGLRDALFADVSWAYAGFRDGTEHVFGDSNLHYFALAPAWTLFFDAAKAFGVYAQAGAGAAYQYSSFHVGGGETAVSGLAPLLQYGVGFRGRPLLGSDARVRLTFRVELSRFRRGYLDDTLIAASLGGGF